MIDLKDSMELEEIRKRLRREIPVDSLCLLRIAEICAKDPEQKARFDERCLSVFRSKIYSGARLSETQLDALRTLDHELAGKYVASRAGRSTARSTADRVADHVARRSDIGEIPPIVDAARRESCKYDLEKFGITYCQILLKHNPSAQMRPFILAMQQAILTGGRVHVRWPRGKGKSTWIKIGILWATLYGHRRFAVCFAANGKNAKAIIGDVWKALDRSVMLMEDFPEVAYPVRMIKGVVQRCATQSCCGKATEILKSTEMLTLPKIEGSVASGAMIICRGVRAGTRGLVDMDQRPDFLFFDDIQSKKTAGSKTATDWLEEFVQDDAMCMGGHDSSIAALKASTPIKPNDLSERFADIEQHPEWITFTTPLVMRWPDNMDLVDTFGAMYRKDLANRDQAFTLSRGFYIERQAEIESGAELLDPLDGDPKTEVSAFHHALILYYSIGREGFDSEYQMKTRRTQEVFTLEPSTICKALNHYERCVVPDECRGVVGFCDVNADANAGLRWGLMAFGQGRVCAMIAYGRYPAKGRLYPENSTPTQARVGIANGVAAVANLIAALPIRKRSGYPVRPTALCFDLGWETQTISRAIKTLRVPFPLIGSHGFGWKKYQPYKAGGDKRDGVVGDVGDHCHLAESANGVYLAFHSDYWREEAQRAFLAPPLQPGSCSMWGSDTTEHYEFAAETCNEKLADKGIGYGGTEFWTWSVSGKNHWGDVYSGCFAVGSWYRLYDATEAVIEHAIREGAKSTPALLRRARRAPRTPLRAPRFRLV